MRGGCSAAAVSCCWVKTLRGFCFPAPHVPTVAGGCRPGGTGAAAAGCGPGGSVHGPGVPWVSAASWVAFRRGCESPLFLGLCFAAGWQRLLVRGLLCPHGTEWLGDRRFLGEGAAGMEVRWGHLLAGTGAAVGGQAEMSRGAALMGSNPGCSRSPRNPLRRVMAEVASPAKP